MFGYIILRDITKKAAQLDLSIFEIKGGFRGFAQVPPGPHYISIEVGGAFTNGFWCYVKPSSVIVKVYDYESKSFHDDTAENEARYSNMALSGVMNHTLIPYVQRDAKFSTLWLRLLSKINVDNFPPELHSETPMTPPENLTSEDLSLWFIEKHKSRFEQAFVDTHNGNIDAFLAEFQYAYVCAIVHKEDKTAFERWTHLIQSIYNAGERSIEKASDLFPPLIDTLILQLSYIPEHWFTADSKALYGVSNLIEDMIDVGIKELAIKAQELSEYLKPRGIPI